jgi:hypothetical protein
MNVWLVCPDECTWPQPPDGATPTGRLGVGGGVFAVVVLVPFAVPTVLAVFVVAVVGAEVALDDELEQAVVARSNRLNASAASVRVPADGVVRMAHLPRRAW